MESTRRDNYTVPEAAKHMRLSQTAVRNLVNTGALRSVKYGVKAIISDRAIEEFFGNVPKQ